MSLRDRVIDTLTEVRDPELDEPITTLRFVSSCQVSPDGDVEIALRLPTPQCAPNFAFLMAADARNAVRRLPGVRDVTIRLEDHYTGEEINSALAADASFAGAFPGETEHHDLEQLRNLFLRKALVARQSRIAERLLGAGVTEGDLLTMRADQLQNTAEGERCLELRASLRLSAGPSAAAFVLPDGRPIELGDLTRWLRTARLVRTSLEVNGGICRSLLAHRYELENECDPEEVTYYEGRPTSRLSRRAEVG